MWNNLTDEEIIERLKALTKSSYEELDGMRKEKGWNWDLMYQVLVSDIEDAE